jgi:hypothetical protein
VDTNRSNAFDLLASLALKGQQWHTLDQVTAAARSCGRRVTGPDADPTIDGVRLLSAIRRGRRLGVVITKGASFLVRAELGAAPA